MADTKVSALPPVDAVAGADELLVNESGTSKKASVTQMAAFLNASPALTGTPTAPTAPAGTNSTQLATTAFVQTRGPVQVFSLASDALTNTTDVMIAIEGLTITVDVGTYVFEYYIRAQTAVVSNSMLFSVNHTGTLTAFMCDLYWPSAGVSASSGAVGQEMPAYGVQYYNSGAIWAHQCTRVKNTPMGPQTGIDTINADIMYRISGMMIVTVAGNLELYHASEENGSGSTVMAGTCLILTKVG